MILDILQYFAQFPSRSGVLDLFHNGSSSYTNYLEIKEFINNLPPAKIPVIKHYIAGQSFDSIKEHVDNFTDVFLFIDFGEITSQKNKKNSFEDSQRIAVTIAMKKNKNLDLIEEAIISDKTLAILNLLRKHMYLDSENRNPYFLGRNTMDHAELIPFVDNPFNCLGWTYIFNTASYDAFNMKSKTVL